MFSVRLIHKWHQSIFDTFEHTSHSFMLLIDSCLPPAPPGVRFVYFRVFSPHSISPFFPVRHHEVSVTVPAALFLSFPFAVVMFFWMDPRRKWVMERNSTFFLLQFHSSYKHCVQMKQFPFFKKKSILIFYSLSHMLYEICQSILIVSAVMSQTFFLFFFLFFFLLGILSPGVFSHIFPLTISFNLKVWCHFQQVFYQYKTGG